MVAGVPLPCSLQLSHLGFEMSVAFDEQIRINDIYIAFQLFQVSIQSMTNILHRVTFVYVTCFGSNLQPKVFQVGCQVLGLDRLPLYGRQVFFFQPIGENFGCSFRAFSLLSIDLNRFAGFGSDILPNKPNKLL